MVFRRRLLTVVAKFIAIVRQRLLVEDMNLLIRRLALFPVLGSERLNVQMVSFWCTTVVDQRCRASGSDMVVRGPFPP